MPNDDTRLFPSLSWSKFNSDFTIPENDDAARVANQVRASVDTWVQNSLAQLEQDMNSRATIAIGQLKNNINSSNNSLKTIQSQIDAVRSGLDNLAVADPVLAVAIANLKTQTDAARAAMQTSLSEWQQNGANTVSTIESIVGTVAKVAAA